MSSGQVSCKFEMFAQQPDLLCVAFMFALCELQENEAWAALLAEISAEALMVA
jgi:hypothetical protein